MCGICGFVGFDDQQLIERMCEIMIHRGPDDHGLFTGPGIALGMRRLSVIDLHTGHQPIANEDQTLWIILNGEIFNYRQLREELKDKGHTFRTSSDTEVVVHLYEEMGTECVRRLRGMFTFAIWDGKSSSLLIARDRVGIKPLYYAAHGGRFAFASEIKALLLCPFVSREMNREALPEYLVLQYVPAPQTLFAGVKKLPPGHTMTVKDGEITLERYWHVQMRTSSSTISEDDAFAEFRERVADAVSSRMISDVPLGALLSGGIDSSVVVALMAQAQGEPVQTFTVGFEPAGGYTEADIARTVADYIGTDHHEITVRPRAAQLLPALVWHMDEPVADAAALPTFLISRFARQKVTVALTGEGGDEFYGGYPRYFLFRWAKTLQRLPRALREDVILRLVRRAPLSDFVQRTLRRILSDGTDAQRHLDWVSNFTPMQVSALLRDGSAATEATEFVERALADAQGDDLIHRLMWFDATVWLVDDILAKVDKMTMATSLEARVPLLDHELLEFVMRLPSKLKVRGITTKYLLRKLARHLLPKDIADRPKHAFVVPLDEWFRGELRQTAEDTFLAPDARISEYLDMEVVREIAGAHFAGAARNGQLLWNLLCLELWHRIFIDQTLHPPSALDIAQSLLEGEI